ncbi:MAG: response regulator transcription factor [Lachnospiraceae bacterium]|nr:response regulator transcription factor [Lachnospiraceae bacterium]
MNILIVDDEVVICEALERHILDYYADNPKEHRTEIIKMDSELQLFDYIENGNKADLIFLDIKLKRCNGIDIAVKLQKADKNLKVVFITGFISYAKQIFKAKPSHFLVKPITKEDVYSVLERIEEEWMEVGNQTVTFKYDNVVYCLNIKDIYYIEARGRQIIVYTQNEEYYLNGNLTEWYEKTKDVMFWCHRSFLVNVEKIMSIGTYEVNLISKEYVPLSRRKRKELQNHLLHKKDHL